MPSRVKLVHVIPVPLTEPMLFKAIGDPVTLLGYSTLTTTALTPTRAPAEF